MVVRQLFERGITDENILNAFRIVPRHLFVPERERAFAYEDSPLPIGEGQTISQPYMVALMTKLLNLKKGEKVLEIGTGSGYQAAILFALGSQVYSVERINLLANNARIVLDSLGYNIKINIGDGSLGWDDFSPYDKIIVTAASPAMSVPWQKQLKIGGKIVFPLEKFVYQDLTVGDKISEEKMQYTSVCGCIFVPLIGKYGYKE